MDTKSNLITRGQAACLILGLEPNKDNRKEAKSILDNTPLDATYCHDTSPLKPFAYGRKLISLNPFIYKQYPDTPPSSPRMGQDSSVNLDDREDKHKEGDRCNNSSDDMATYEDDDSNSQSSEDTSDNYSKSNVLCIAKSISFTSVENEELYERGFFTSTAMYNEVEKHLPKLKQFVSLSSFSKWISVEGKHFGKRVTRRQERRAEKGRHLFVMKTSIVRSLNETSLSFRRHVESRINGWINIGYARKSPSNETDETRIRLLQLMIIKLQNRCFCERIYVSPKTLSTKSIMERDYGDVDKGVIVGQLSGCNGDTQDMLVYLASTLNDVRLCIISYAGLSNDPDNVYEFLR